jgi:hypothetical protein
MRRNGGFSCVAVARALISVPSLGSLPRAVWALPPAADQPRYPMLPSLVLPSAASARSCRGRVQRENPQNGFR